VAFVPHHWRETQVAAPGNQIVVDLIDLEGILAVLDSSGVGWERAEKDARFGLALIRLGDLGNIPAGYKDPDAVSPLDRLISYVKAFAGSHSDREPSVGKNRLVGSIMGSIEGLPYTRGGVSGPYTGDGGREAYIGGDRGDPQWDGSLGGFPKRKSPPGPQVKVGVLDTRLFAHPDLAGRYLAGNDALVPATTVGTPNSEAHATFIAGVILARAPNADLVVGNMLNDYNMCGSSWDVAQKMADSADAGVSVLNISFGAATHDDKPPLVMRKTVQALTRRGVIIVAAAGNQGQRKEKIWPAALDEVVAVGAGARVPGEDDFEVEAFSPRQPWVDLLAPGVEVRSLFKASGYATWDGTSFAAAGVTGAIAHLVETGHMTAAQAVAVLQTPPSSRRQAAGGSVNDIGATELASRVRSRPGDTVGPYTGGAGHGPYTGGGIRGPYTGPYTGTGAGPYVGGGSGVPGPYIGQYMGGVPGAYTGGGLGGGHGYGPTGEDRAAGTPEPSKGADADGGGSQARDRYLKGQCPESVPVGEPFGLLASIVLAGGPGSAKLERPLEVPPEGQDVLLEVNAPWLRVLGPRRQIVHVPPDGDSEPAEFELRADAPGPRSVTLAAWNGGTYLGQLVIEITARGGHLAGPDRNIFAGITTESTEGAVSLVVRYDPAQKKYRFEFRDEDNPGEVMTDLDDKPGLRVERLVAALDELAKGRSGYSVGQARDYLVNAGAELWQQLVPQGLQDQFWDRQHRIRQLTILADKDVVPWELLYPLDSRHNAGFLVEQFPVTRAIFKWRPARTLRLWPARFVLPESSLPEARNEVEAMRQLLDPGQPPGEVISGLTSLTDLISSGNFGLLHFACHNTYNPADGSSIKLGNAPFTPMLMTTAVTNKVLARSAPTVFINACRSAGQAATYNRLDGWASKFLEAGAAAFVGSLWAVSDGAAREFAQELYSRLQAGSSLGEAVKSARITAASQLDDPTWLAYAVYGDPRATLSQLRP
jgi:hypothetical protein